MQNDLLHAQLTQLVIMAMREVRTPATALGTIRTVRGRRWLPSIHHRRSARTPDLRRLR